MSSLKADAVKCLHYFWSQRFKKRIENMYGTIRYDENTISIVVYLASTSLNTPEMWRTAISCPSDQQLHSSIKVKFAYHCVQPVEKQGDIENIAENLVSLIICSSVFNSWCIVFPHIYSQLHLGKFCGIFTSDIRKQTTRKQIQKFERNCREIFRYPCLE